MSAYTETVAILADERTDEIGRAHVAVGEGDDIIVLTATDEDGTEAALPLSIAEALELIAKLSGAVAAAAANR